MVDPAETVVAALVEVVERVIELLLDVLFDEGDVRWDFRNQAQCFLCIVAGEAGTE